MYEHFSKAGGLLTYEEEEDDELAVVPMSVPLNHARLRFR